MTGPPVRLDTLEIPMHHSWRDAAHTIAATFVLGVVVGVVTGLVATGPTYIDHMERAARSGSDAVTEWLDGDASTTAARRFAETSRSR